MALGLPSPREIPGRLYRHMLKAPKQVNRWELLRTFIALLYLFIVAYFMVFMQQLSDRRWNQADPKLNDLAFDWFPFVDRVDVADAFVTSALAFMVFGNLLLLTHWCDRIVFVRRCLWIIGTLYFFRGFTLIVTTLPSPRDCVPPNAQSTQEMFIIGLEMIISKTKACTDNVYSGHTMILTSSVLLWRIHTRYTFIIAYVFCHAVVGIIMVLFTHLHYFVDILLAILITYSVFSLYFYGLDMAVHRCYHLTPYKLQCQCPDQAPWWRRVLANCFYTRRDTTADSVYGYDTGLPYQTASTSPAMAPGTAVSAEEYKRVAMTPRILNNEIPTLIAWLDGLDLRVKQFSSTAAVSQCPLHPSKPDAPIMSEVAVR
ncbi:hypothetical protein H4R34_003170 [Dimargaris verticillata]|uniref:Sphingomyelin synthase-like domain-containing protein n=1 Tax=Dimargaris verticillata TaxID=2761393 RepID=A0A9W8E9A8_9FUNG|nr:hypothetical protein H4R34_003170 [Dimargaris verticillata]